MWNYGILYSDVFFELTHFLPMFQFISMFTSFLEQMNQNVRSNHLQMFFKTSILKNFAIFTGKQLCWSLFLISWRPWLTHLTPMFTSDVFRGIDMEHWAKMGSWKLEMKKNSFIKQLQMKVYVFIEVMHRNYDANIILWRYCYDASNISEYQIFLF